MTLHNSLLPFIVQVYKVILEVVFKLAPTVLIAGLNLQIMIVYRKVIDFN